MVRPRPRNAPSIEAYGSILLLLEVHIPLLGVERYTRNRCSA